MDARAPCLVAALEVLRQRAGRRRPAAARPPGNLNNWPLPHAICPCGLRMPQWLDAYAQVHAVLVFPFVLVHRSVVLDT